MAESVLFPLAFLALAAFTIRGFFDPMEQPVMGARTGWAASGVLLDLARHPAKLPAGASVAQVYGLLGLVLVKPILIVFFNVLCAAFIALRGRLRYEPGSLREVAVPMAGTTIMLALPLSEHLPVWLGHPISYPPTWTLGVFMMAAVLSVCGGVIALHGLLHLRRNFSVFVEVREVVLSGPYRHVRHPLYIGEILLGVGLVLSMPSLFGLVVVALLVVFQIARARMEERRLAAASPEYARRLATTGMFFPRLGAGRQEPADTPARGTGVRRVAIGLVLAALALIAVWIGTRPEAGRPRTAPASGADEVPSRREDAAGLERPTAQVPAAQVPAAQMPAAQAPAASRVTPAQFEQLLQAAKDAHARRDWRGAADLYGRLVEGAPEVPEMPLFLGFCCLQLGDTVQARAAYEEAVRRMPESPDAANGLAWALLKTGGPVQRAITLAEFATSRAPTADNYDTLARAYAMAHECDRAAEAARRIRELEPDGELYRETVQAIGRSCP